MTFVYIAYAFVFNSVLAVVHGLLCQNGSTIIGGLRPISSWNMVECHEDKEHCIRLEAAVTMFGFVQGATEDIDTTFFKLK